jgi:hypothetical protein
VTISKPRAGAEVPDHDLVALGFTYENGVLRAPGPCSVKLMPVQNRYQIKIELPRGNSSLIFDVRKDELKIGFNKTRSWRMEPKP